MDNNEEKHEYNETHHKRCDDIIAHAITSMHENGRYAEEITLRFNTLAMTLSIALIIFFSTQVGNDILYLGSFYWLISIIFLSGIAIIVAFKSYYNEANKIRNHYKELHKFRENFKYNEFEKYFDNMLKEQLSSNFWFKNINKTTILTASIFVIGVGYSLYDICRLIQK